MPDGSHIGVTTPLTETERAESEKAEAEKARLDRQEAERPVPVELTKAHTGEYADSPVRMRQTGSSWATTGLFLLGAMAAFVYAKAVLMPTVLALLLALTFAPVRRWFEGIHVPTGVTAAIITLGLLFGLVASFAGISAPLTDYVTNAPQILSEAEGKLRSLTETVSNVAEAGDALEAAEEEGAPERVVIEQPGLVAQVAGVAPFILAQVVLTLVLLFFILASGDMFYEKIVHSIGSFRDKRKAVRIIRDIEGKLSRYFFVITIINAGLGVAIGLAMWAMGMPHPYLFGIFAFVFNFIPYVGAIAGVALATIIGIVTFDQVGTAFLAGLVYFCCTSFEGQFVTPYAVGRSLKLNTVVVFLAVAFWGWMWSVVGMIVAMPILIALRAFSEHIPKLHGLGDFLSARHAEIETEREQAEEAAGDARRAAG